MRIIENIIYVERPSERLALDLYRPYRRPRATVIFAHGGGFRKGSRTSAEAFALARRFTRDGFAFASLSYRLNTSLEASEVKHRKAIRINRRRALQEGVILSKRLMGAAGEAARQDIGAAVSFVRRNAESWGVAHPATFVVGISAGGIAALSLAHQPDNLPTLSMPNAVVGLGAAMMHPWALTPKGAPCLMVHSTMDRVIKPANLRRTQKAARQAGAPLRGLVCARRGHGAPVDALLNDKDEAGTPYWTHMRMLFDVSMDQSNARNRLIRLDVSQRPPPSF